MAWWNLDGAISSCVAAYQAIGAASYAASKVNLANPGTYNAADGAAHPSWEAETGWTFAGASSQYLDTGVVVAEGMTIVVRFSNASADGVITGMNNTGMRYHIQPWRSASGNSLAYGYGVSGLENGAANSKVTVGVMANSANGGYLDGVLKVNLSGFSWSGTTTYTFPVGARTSSNGTLYSYFTGNVQAIAYYSATLTIEQIAALVTAMNALPVSADALVAADFTLSAVTFDAPTLTNETGTDDLTALDFSLDAITFDAPTLEYHWNTPDCRTYAIESESRTLAIEAESRTLAIEAESRGLKILCGSATAYTVTGLVYNGLTGKDLTLTQPTFDAPTLVSYPIPLPDPAFAILPFGISDDGDGTFSVSPEFTLASHSGITVSKTYYVATTGLDTNDGSAGSPFKTMGKAIGMADVDRIYVAAGWYKSWDSSFTPPTRNIQIIGVGNVYMAQDWSGNLTWTLDTTHYEAACVTTVLAVMDRSATDANGDWSLLTLKTSEAEVEANAASWWLDDPGNVLHVHTHDGRAPDSDVVVLFSTSAIVNWTIDNLTVYIENIKFVGASGGVTIGSATSAGTGTKALLKDCEMDGVDVSGYGFYALGCPEMILQNCTAKRTDDDGVRSNSANTIVSNVVEWDCTMRNCGKAGDTAVNGSSSHSDGIMVRINGSYHHTYGRPVHDYNNGHSWCLGVHANDSLVATLPNFEMTGTTGEMWCDQCVSANSTYDYAGAIHKHNCTGDATDQAGPDTYDY